jgi:uncharacterized protein
MLRSFTITVFLLITTHYVLGQSAKVLVQNAKLNSPTKAAINIKWYSQSLVYPKGVNVYRRLQGENTWMKLTNTPLMIQQAVPAALIKQDEELKAFHGIAKDLAKSKNNGFVLLSLFGKSFQSADFSRLIGIQWDDDKVTWGNVYEYRVTQLINGQEVELGVSNTIKAGGYQWGNPVEGFVAALDKKIIKFNWKPDENRFYGVDIYRSTSLDTVSKKMNKKPIVLSETKGAPASDAMFQDKEVEEGVTYYYRISGLDFFGGELALSAKVEVKVVDITPPTSPIEVKTSVQSMNVKVSWTGRPSPDLVGYSMYRSPKSEGPFSKVNQVIIDKADSVYLDVVPQPGYYYYYVAAVDKAGNEGASERSLIEVKDIVPPAIPKNIMAKPDTGKIVLSWSGNMEKDLMGYYVYRSIKKQKSSSFVLVNAEPLKDSTYTQVFPKNANNLFSFRVVSVDTSYNKSEPSEIVSARMPDAVPPLKPIIKNILLRNDTVMVKWFANPDTDLAGYELYKYESDPSLRVKVNQSKISPSVLSFADRVKSSGNFHYQLQAIDSAGNISVSSDPFPVTTVEKFIYNFKEVTAKFQKRKGANIVTWTGSTTTQPLKGFVVFRKSEPETVWRPLTGLLQINEYEDRELLAKTKYFYQVRAYSGSGDMVQSSEVSLKSGGTK